MLRVPVMLLLLVVTAGLAACGSGDGGSTAATTRAATTAAQPGRYTVAEVAKRIGLKDAAGGGWTSITGCRVTRVLTTHAEVLQHRTSTDSLVVTNPADDIGVVFAEAPHCREALTANLTLAK